MKKEFKCSEDTKEWVPDGTYEAQCIKHELGYMYGSHRLYLHFKIVDFGQYQGKQVFMSFNMPDPDKIRPGSKYYRFWCMANQWNKPSKKTMMSPKIFKNKIFNIKTRSVQPKGFPESYKYSVVDDMEITAG